MSTGAGEAPVPSEIDVVVQAWQEFQPSQAALFSAAGQCVRIPDPKRILILQDAANVTIGTFKEASAAILNSDDLSLNERTLSLGAMLLKCEAERVDHFTVLSPEAGFACAKIDVQAFAETRQDEFGCGKPIPEIIDETTEKYKTNLTVDVTFLHKAIRETRKSKVLYFMNSLKKPGIEVAKTTIGTAVGGLVAYSVIKDIEKRRID